MEEGTPLGRMPAALEAGSVRYLLPVGGIVHDLASLMGKPFTLKATGVLTCVCCGRRVNKFYGQGFCYPCLRDAPEAAECIIRPELCQAHLGGGRDPDWECRYHATEHVVYLSWTGGLKVGVTRATQVPTRWIDQGAVAALVVARTPYRQLAGLIEVDLKCLFADRTDWRAMLRLVTHAPDVLLEARSRIAPALRYDLREFLVGDAGPVSISYPVLAYPPKITSVQLARVREVGGLLLGAKGQYLIWEDGSALNVRNHAGWHVVAENGPVVRNLPVSTPLKHPGFGQ